MPKIIFLNCMDFSPCRSLVRKSTIIFSALQCSTQTSPLSIRSLIAKYLTSMARFLFPRQVFPFFCIKIADVLSCNSTFCFYGHPKTFRNLLTHIIFDRKSSTATNSATVNERTFRCYFMLPVLLCLHPRKSSKDPRIGCKDLCES